jgi:hypothetical protein
MTWGTFANFKPSCFTLTDAAKRQGELLHKPDGSGRYAFAELLRQMAIDKEFRALPERQQTPFARTVWAAGRHDASCLSPILLGMMMEAAPTHNGVQRQ